MYAFKRKIPFCIVKTYFIYITFDNSAKDAVVFLWLFRKGSGMLAGHKEAGLPNRRVDGFVAPLLCGPLCGVPQVGESYF